MLQRSKAFQQAERKYTALVLSLPLTNDFRSKKAMMGPIGVYGGPIGTKGFSGGDLKDIT